MNKSRLSTAVSVLTILMCNIIFATLTIVNASSNISADIVNPTGSITISGATLSNGTWYTNSNPITLNITASDNVTESGDIDMYISTNILTAEQIKSNSITWTDYSSTYKYTVPNTSTNTKTNLYLYLKDEAGNISPVISGETTSTYSVTFSGDGTNLPSADVAQVGMAFYIPMSEPTPPDGKYFLGWSLASGDGASVQWMPDSFVEPKYIKGDVTFYAVYSNRAPLLSNMISIGDYVALPANYSNAIASVNYDGWRVLYTSGENDEEVVLVSAGIPLTYETEGTSSTAVTDLTTNFATTTYAQNGFSDIEPLFASLSEYVSSVRSINVSDIEKLTSKTLSINDSLASYKSLLNVNQNYWLASEADATDLYNINSDGIVETASTETYGVRPVVFLKTTTCTSGKNSAGEWLLAKEPVISDVMNIGDYVSYSGNGTATITAVDSGHTTGQTITASDYSSTKWRVWSISGDEVKIIPEKPIGTVTLKGHVGVANAVETLNNTSKAFANSSLGVSISNVRSLNVDDVNELSGYTPNYTVRNAYYPFGTDITGMSLLTYNEKTYTPKVHIDTVEYKFIKGLNGVDGGGEEYSGDDGITYLRPTTESPVYCTQVYYNYNPSNYGISGSSLKVGDLFYTTAGFLASQSVYLENGNITNSVRLAGNSTINDCSTVAKSSGTSNARSYGILPLVTLSANLLKVSSGEGTSGLPYTLTTK